MFRRPFASLLLLTLVACASAPRTDDLTDANETQGDFAPRDGREAQLPITSRRVGDVTYALNVQEEDTDGTILYWVRLLVRNTGDARLEGPITCRITDRDGVAVPAIPKDAVLQVALASANAGPGGARQAANYAGLAGTAAGLAGAPVPGIGFVGPAAALFSASGGGNRRSATQRAQWALTHWMPETLALDPGTARGGVLAFAAPRPRPLTITIEFADGTCVATSQ